MLRSRETTSGLRRTSAGRASRAWRVLAALRVVAIGLLIVVLSVGLPLRGAEARAARRDAPSGAVIRIAELPPEGRTVLALIRAGGPFASHRDGVVFANREGLLSRRPRGYYAEYTVPTPGATNRGARRIVAGRGATGDFRTSDEYYFTNDHYQSFRRIAQ